MNPLMALLYLDARQAELSRRARERHVDPAANARVSRSRSSRLRF
jgi:hypothetical protein